jgi:predicted membrane protein
VPAYIPRRENPIEKNVSSIVPDCIIFGIAFQQRGGLVEGFFAPVLSQFLV